MTNESYIHQHLRDDVRQLALKKVPEGVNLVWCLQQIEGWQLAQKKLPRWAANEEKLWYPPRLSMEQCSSESTALYKRQLVERLIGEEDRESMIDLTGGFGIDFSYLASSFHKATYVEFQEQLCDIARHNFPLLGLPHVGILQQDCGTLALSERYSLVFMDPARRDVAGRKTVAIKDCTPDVVEMQDYLLAHTRYLIIKLSPMLDIAQALRELKHVTEVHVVSVRGECKELLLVLCPDVNSSPHYYCINLESDDIVLHCDEMERRNPPSILHDGSISGKYLFEPNASILKAGCQDLLCARYGVSKIHPCSNLYVGEQHIPEFPGREFLIDDFCDFGKGAMKKMLQGIDKANLTIRNFPTSVAELRKKLKLKEGGDIYLFATTLYDGTHVILKCRKKVS